jgi:hypothetical protein
MPFDQPALFQPADGVGDRGRVDHEALAHLAHGHRPAPGEGEQAKRLISGESQAVRLQDGLDPGQQQLLHPHDGGDGRHVVGVRGPPDAPLAVGLGNGIERVWIGHAPTVRDTALRMRGARLRRSPRSLALTSAGNYFNVRMLVVQASGLCLARPGSLVREVCHVRFGDP